MANAARIRAAPSPSTAPFSELRPWAQGGRWSLFSGDCLQRLAELPAESVDLVFADPPYFLSNGGFTCQSGRRAPVEKGRWDASAGIEADHAFTRAWLEACGRVLKPTGSIWVSGTQHVIFSVGFAMQSLGWRLLNTVTWYKPNASPNLSDDGEGRVWTSTSPRGEEKALGRHPTQKPVALLTRIVEATAAEDGLVLDPFSGSGTTGVAALRLGRRYLGIERDPEWLALARARLEAESDGAPVPPAERFGPRPSARPRR